MIEAARALFEEVGFHDTTVRMIAERAGLSPGGVFTTFEDKVAILCQIIAEQRNSMLEALEQQTRDPSGTARDRLIRFTELTVAHEAPRLRMVTAYIGASYGWSKQLEEEHRRLHRRTIDLIGGILRDGVACGEICESVDLELLLEMVAAIYQRNFRTARFADLDETALCERFRRQINLIFDGCAPR